MKKMKNKQVKQMMCDLLKSKMKAKGEDYKFKFIDGYLALNYKSSWWSYAPSFGSISIKAMDHWLFIRNHKIEKESWQVTIK